MFKHARRTVVATAFCFGLAFSLGAFAQDECQACIDDCYVQYEECLNTGMFCKPALNRCTAACGCQV
ncbi:hypothetical protein SAMN04487939_101626 [Lysobacter sp. yr284]|uniref:hypothetical protein n=1 Tax=Lysobacter TaxID=68 RepID=UPI000896BE47|nr:hypothetical protein [Lysobacter sp. yr284]SDY28336.1 hypothetical protein SAMN04487939_101626 [Lysobacter sp. yr284]